MRVSVQIVLSTVPGMCLVLQNGSKIVVVFIFICGLCPFLLSPLFPFTINVYGMSNFPG